MKFLHRGLLRSLFFIACFSILLPLGTDGTIIRFQQKGSLSSISFSFFLLLFLGAHGHHCQALAEEELQLPLFFFSFNAAIFFPSLLLPIYFMVLVRKFVLFCFVVFATLVDVNPKKNKDCWRRGTCLN